MNNEFLEQLSELNKDVNYSIRIIDSMLLDLMEEKRIPVPRKMVKRSFCSRLFGGKNGRAN